ncbi:hypothetical protein OG218_25695 [Kineococcus sp. NBC_00420]|uniref:hypothetical protein n=1 Tax=Kineococcus sp. NBC_00420 TaxID=2903564 RepID=UPI002E1E3796
MAGLRFVVAHTGGLLLPFVLRDRGVQAEAAIRQFSRRSCGPDDENGVIPPWSRPQVHVEVDDAAGSAHPGGGPTSGGEDDVGVQARCWIEEVPRDRILSLR